MLSAVAGVADRLGDTNVPVVAAAALRRNCRRDPNPSLRKAFAPFRIADDAHRKSPRASPGACSRRRQDAVADGSRLKSYQFSIGPDGANCQSARNGTSKPRGRLLLDSRRCAANAGSPPNMGAQGEDHGTKPCSRACWSAARSHPPRRPRRRMRRRAAGRQEADRHPGTGAGRSSRA